jgi:7-cyano-7-deazaguanine synthase
MTTEPRAVVLLSGGLDSATILAVAAEQGYRCYALSVMYGQRHGAELEAAHTLARTLGAAEHKVVHIGLDAIGGSALTDPSIPVPLVPSEGIPVTYVPARNTVLLALALGWAEVIGARAIFVGVNAIDYAGYPDCRPAFIQAFERLANVATRAGVEGAEFRIHAPLIRLSKAQIIREGIRLGLDYGLTVSCYAADKRGRACGACDACRLRRQGFAAAGIPDPTCYR